MLRVVMLIADVPRFVTVMLRFTILFRLTVPKSRLDGVNRSSGRTVTVRATAVECVVAPSVPVMVIV